MLRNWIFYLKGWTPPFAVNVESFKFVPRVQKINELEVSMKDYS